MLNAGLCAEIDWNADHGTIQQAVFQLSQVRDWKIGLVEYSEDLPVEDYLKKLGSELSTQKLALISIDIDSDSYVLSLLKMELCEQAVKLGEKIGVKLKKW